MGRRTAFPWTLLLTTLLLPGVVSAGESIRAQCPFGSFTNLAARLFRSQFDASLPPTQIQVYPTNQYTPAVHRLLQLAANICDATTNRTDLTDAPCLPSVFRPLFRSDTNGSVFIAGFREVQDAGLADPATAPVIVDLDDDAGRACIPMLGVPFDPGDQNEPMVFGVPLVIGAKKGFPNFNEFSMQNCLTMTRRLQFQRADPDPDGTVGPIIETNQIYIIGISNTFGIEAWNSYSNTFPRDLRLTAIVELMLSMTNQTPGPVGVIYTNCFAWATVTNIPGGTWAGFANSEMVNALQPSFRIALTNDPNASPTCNAGSLLTNSVWRPVGASGAGFDPLTNVFEQSSTYGFPIPQLCLSLKERVRFFLVDVSVMPNRIVDYVNLSRSELTVDVAQKVQDLNGLADTTINKTGTGNPWSTNRFFGRSSVFVPTIGVLNQVLRNRSASAADGNPRYVFDRGTGPTVHYAIDSFRSQFLPPGVISSIFADDAGRMFYKSNVFYTPFNPASAIYQHISWQANDPLVHYTVEDLLGGPHGFTNSISVDGNSRNPPLYNMGRVNSAYEPWDSINPFSGGSSTRTDLSVKDPLVLYSDDWNFPTNFVPSFGWLGRIHRGTPWQTVYLKSQVANDYAWRFWTGITNTSTAAQMHPTNDWRLPDLFGQWLRTKRFDRLQSINAAFADDWRPVLGGLVALTNNPTQTNFFYGRTPEFESVVMASESPQAGVIADGIESARAGRPGGYFRTVGGLLAVPELSVASPWLDRTTNALRFEINDEAYEALPGQVLSLVRADSVGSLTSSNGRVTIKFTGDDDHTYVIERSSNLGDWFPVCVSRPRDGVLSVAIEDRRSPRRMFYRSVMVPRFREWRSPKKFLFYPRRSVFIGGDESRDFGRGQGHPDEGAHR